MHSCIRHSFQNPIKKGGLSDQTRTIFPFSKCSPCETKPWYKATHSDSFIEILLHGNPLPLQECSYVRHGLLFVLIETDGWDTPGNIQTTIRFGCSLNNLLYISMCLQVALLRMTWKNLSLQHQKQIRPLSSIFVPLCSLIRFLASHKSHPWSFPEKPICVCAVWSKGRPENKIRMFSVYFQTKLWWLHWLQCCLSLQMNQFQNSSVLLTKT